MFLSPGSRANARNIVPPTRVAPGFPVAGANLNFFVSLSGNDANSGLSSAAPLLTVQRGLNVAASYNYQSLFSPTITLSTGFYSLTQALSLPELVNPGNNGQISGATGTPSDVTLSCNNKVVTATGSDSVWNMAGITLDSSGVQDCISLNGAASLSFNGTMTFSSNTGGNLIKAQNFSRFFSQAKTININSTNWRDFLNGTNFCSFTFFNNTINLSTNAVTNFIAWIAGFNYCFFNWHGNTTNSTIGTPVPSNVIQITDMSHIFSDTGNIVDFPGSSVGGVTYDPSCFLVKFGNVYGSNFGNTISGSPSTVQLSTGSCAVFKDSGGSSVFLAYNDGGTIKKVSLV